MNLEKRILLGRIYNKLSWFFCSPRSLQEKLQIEVDENTTIKQFLDQIEPLYLESIGRKAQEQEEVVEEPTIETPAPELPMSVFELLSI